jgi:hypothetical protein
MGTSSERGRSLSLPVLLSSRETTASTAPANGSGKLQPLDKTGSRHWRLYVQLMQARDLPVVASGGAGSREPCAICCMSLVHVGGVNGKSDISQVC